jgi:hypothetical protein
MKMSRRKLDWYDLEEEMTVGERMTVNEEKESVAVKIVDAVDAIIGNDTPLVLLGRDKDRIHDLMIAILKEKAPARQSVELWKNIAHAWVDGAEVEFWDLNPNAEQTEWISLDDDEFFRYDENVVLRIKEK